MSIDFNSLPSEIKGHILTFIEPEEKTLESIKLCAGQVRALISKPTETDKPVLDAKLKQLFKEAEMARLTSKYSAFNGTHKGFMEHRDKVMALPNPHTHNIDEDLLTDSDQKFRAIFIIHYLPERIPILLDALNSGSYILSRESSQKTYTPEIEQDIRKIIDLMPESIHCREAYSQHYFSIPVLYLACANHRIPTHIIELLLQKGANPNDFLCSNENATPKLISEMNQFLNNPKPFQFQPFKNLSRERLETLRDLFVKYGAVDDAAENT